MNPETLERIEKVADELALLYAGEPDEKVESSVHVMRANLEKDFSEIFQSSSEVAQAVDMFLGAVQARRRAIEKSSGVFSA